MQINPKWIKGETSLSKLMLTGYNIRRVWFTLSMYAPPEKRVSLEKTIIAILKCLYEEKYP